jgi:hypothetical protein
MLSASINSREDLDAAKDTPAHSQFMEMLQGSIFKLEKDDESKRWKFNEDLTLIKQFGFERSDFPNATPPNLPEYIAPPSHEPDPKMVGIDFEGVMCSATREDQNGLVAVIMAFTLQKEKFQPTSFGFSNGNKLTLTVRNMQKFLDAWMPFRQSFFKPE